MIGRQSWCVVALLFVGFGQSATTSDTARKSSDAPPPDVVSNGTRVHAQKDSIYTRTIAAIRDNQKSSIEYRSLIVEVTDSLSKTRKFVAHILYDPPTKLCYWEYFELTENVNIDHTWEAKTLENFSTIYVSRDRLTRFNTTIPTPFLISESCRRYDTVREAENALLHAFVSRVDRNAVANPGVIIPLNDLCDLWAVCGNLL